MATPYLVITDGTTTITIQAASGAVGNYALRRWIPTVAGLRRSLLGGRGPYEDVVEEMQLTLIDTTAAGCYTRLETLNTLLDQAERSYYGEDRTPVYIHFAPAGATVSSDSAPLKARIIGRASGNETSGVGLEPSYDGVSFTFQLDITLRFLRMGEWLLNDQSASSSATDNGTVASVDLTTATNLQSPTDISMTKVVLQSSRAFVILSDEEKIDVLNVDTMTATGYTAFDDSAKFARNTNVLRYTPPDMVENSSGSKNTTASTGVQLTSGIFAVFANIRNNSNTTSYTMRVKLTGDGPITYTPYHYIPPYTSAAYPQWQFIGLAYSWRLLSIIINLQASAVSGTLDIDTLVIVNTTTSKTNILGTSLLESGAAAYLSGGGALAILHNLDAATPFLYPRSQSSAGSSVYVHTSQGDPVFTTKAAIIYACLLATGTSASLDAWRQADGGTVLANVWTATRAVGYVSPK